MHLGEISFCDRVGFNIKSDDIKRKLLEQLEGTTGFKVIQKHYERFDVNNSCVNRLNTMPHMLSLRTNGNPYLLYLTKYNYENQCIFIDKKVQHGYFYPRMILSKLWFDPSLFDNTLLDGEMVKTNSGEWHFIVNDIICLNNTMLDKHNLVKRVSIVYDVLKNQFYDDEFNCCRLFVKRYFTLSDMESMVREFLPSLPYTCRGIYFKPFYLKFKDVLINFDDSLVQKVVRFKYKHIDGQTFKETHQPINQLPPPVQAQAPQAPQIQLPQPTVVQTGLCPERVLYARKTNNTDLYELFEGQSEIKSIGVALINSIKTSKMMKEIFRSLNSTERVALKCVYNEKFGKYAPVAPA